LGVEEVLPELKLMDKFILMDFQVSARNFLDFALII
jgi:hypothetical protein